jgi:hypothetical protein
MGFILAMQARQAELVARRNEQEAQRQREEAEQSKDAWLKVSELYWEAATDAEIRAGRARLDADLLAHAHTTDKMAGLLRLARPLKDAVTTPAIGPNFSGTTLTYFRKNPEFMRLREFQTAAVITAGQEFLPLVPPVETSSPGLPTGNTPWVRDETDFACSPDRTLCAIHCFREGVTLWSFPTFTRAGLLREHDEQVLQFGFIQDSKTIWTFDTDSVARFWNIDGSLRARTPLSLHRFVYPAGLTYQQLLGSIDFIGVNPPNECFVAYGIAILRSKHVEWVEYKEDGELIRMTRKEGTEEQPGPVELYSTHTGQLIRRLDRPGRTVSGWQTSPDGRWLIYLDNVSDAEEGKQPAEGDHQLVIVSATDGRELARLGHSWATPDLSITFSLRGTWLLAYQPGDTPQVALWRTADWIQVNDSALEDALAQPDDSFNLGFDGLNHVRFLTDDLLCVGSGTVQLGKPGSWTPDSTGLLYAGSTHSELGGSLLRQGYNLFSVAPIQLIAPPDGRMFHPRLAELSPDGRFWGSLDTVTDRTLPASSLFGEKILPHQDPWAFFEEPDLPAFFSPAECRGRYFPGYGTVGVTHTDDRFELRILPDPKKLDIPPQLLELWAQVITGGELAADGGFKPWDQPTWMAKQRELAAAKAPYADFPFPGWAATEPNLWYLIKARSSQDESERALHEGEWRRLTGRRPPVVEPDSWRTPEPARAANEPGAQ